MLHLLCKCGPRSSGLPESPLPSYGKIELFQIKRIYSKPVILLSTSDFCGSERDRSVGGKRFVSERVEDDRLVLPITFLVEHRLLPAVSGPSVEESRSKYLIWKLCIEEI